MNNYNSKLVKVAEALVKINEWKDTGRYLYRFETLFKNTDLADKTVLDIGCGVGSLTLGMAAKGVRSAIGLEPELDGSTDGYIETGQKLAASFGFDNLIIRSCTLDDYDFAEGPFDIIVMHDVINHLNEDACMELHRSETARQTYVSLLAHLLKHLKPGGQLIAVDCARNNFWGDLSLPNPACRTIEWEKHQNPKIWGGILHAAGFDSIDYWWNPVYKLRYLGPFGRSKLIAYMTNSHFVLQARKSQEG